ncbi:hypothetical protein AYI69_g3603 [Smittium culicis]|uniref:Uncharacterized protein n=1 Tax=Smittium culicis TaxID=133412 RepID=A0A1R1YJ82_9FUNG|nr:hypothetical protein AYI69_g3603 [Smittium culicis]
MCDAALSLIYTLDFQTPVIYLNAPNLNSWLSSPYLKDLNPMHRFNTSAVQSIVLDTISFPLLFKLDFSPIKYSYPLSFPIEFDSGYSYLDEKPDIDLACDISSYRQSTSFLFELKSSISKSMPFKSLHGDDQVEAWSEQILYESEKYN